MHIATVYCRNYTLQKHPSSKQINELMDAIHEVPMMLFRWDENKIHELKNHLACFDNSKWENSPDLVAVFEYSLERCLNEQEK